MDHRHALTLAFVFCASTVSAQEPVSRGPDVASWATAAANPALAAIQAWRSTDRGCQFGRLAISEAIANGVALTMKRFIVSPRPCAGCAADGMPSGHTANSAVGFLSDQWALGLSFTVATGVLRYEAHRHTIKQVLAGAAIGVGAEYAGRLLKCGP